MLKMNGISKTFLINKKPFKVLQKIYLEIKSGDIFGLLGSTGSGKTTLLRIMNGFIKSDNEQNITRGFTHIESAMIFQNFNLLHNLNVFENAALPLKLRKIPKKEINDKINHLLEIVGLLPFKNNYPKNLSGGQKQRVAIVRALSINPKIIFCDEPTSSLDYTTGFNILKIIKDIHHQFKTTIVLISHDIKVIKCLCNKVIILDKGFIVKNINLKTRIIKPLTYEEAFL
ncbi:ABC transporter ATP-binding protein [Candidatus Phytoplasma phoenicium]|uniref:ABC transporter ATP-binding protein n=1 Tax=Candidatus Phytoplasma phoenicium TaxID=198422 RepID=A0A2S8NTV0_9MOLU|nr:ABC transporter ATP-binding protein [Candidatus Phytoplasma phoenicium]